ncbi:MAG: hypothetical protein II655_12615, partial [Thermoguttaceae bacterium]|nr:hypothetical protein [Thermoguttaceae bacterium]
MGKVFIINDDGSKREVLNIQELQELARQGAVLPETKIEAKGRVVNAGKIKELTGVFIATRIQRQNAEKAGGAAVNDAPEVNGASPDAFKALEELGSGAPADTALPPAADSEVEGALYAGEMVIPEEFKPKPEAVKKAKQKKDDAFEALLAKYNLLHISDKAVSHTEIEIRSVRPRKSIHPKPPYRPLSPGQLSVTSGLGLLLLLIGL